MRQADQGPEEPNQKTLRSRRWMRPPRVTCRATNTSLAFRARVKIVASKTNQAAAQPVSHLLFHAVQLDPGGKRSVNSLCDQHITTQHWEESEY